MIEKDYVLGWALFGLKNVSDIIFKGGTALSKVYFPETWRLSEDLDFSTTHNDWGILGTQVSDALKAASGDSGIEFSIRSQYSNPSYLQLKVQYYAILHRNWLRVDMTSDSPL